MKKKIILLIGIFLGLVLLLFRAKPLISPTTPPKPTWGLHTNQRYGHQLLYPASWQVEEWDIQQAANLKRVPDGSIWYQAIFFGKDGHFEILIWENRSQAPVRNWLTWFRHEDLNLKDVPKEENFTVAELPAFRFVQKETSKNKPLLYIFFGQGNKVFEFVEEREDLAGIATPSGRLLSHPVYDKIIDSFKFLE